MNKLMNLNSTLDSGITAPDLVINKFEEEVLQGLTETPKRLQSKFFYDEQGDSLFQQIMACPEYYLTGCELEILSSRTAELAGNICSSGEPFDLVELGAGDATKSEYLLSYLANTGVDFNYLPIDISGNILHVLQERLGRKIPKLSVIPLAGEYFEMLAQTSLRGQRRRVILFLGANIGNMSEEEATSFCETLREHLQPGDLLIIGFDLKKNPRTILNAYDDAAGITAKFNLNLLSRINRELEGDFDLGHFEHYQSYDPETGACKSYLVSLSDQQVSIGGQYVHFAKNETIYMEVSQKYTIAETDRLAERGGFLPVQHFLDSKGWFADICWKAI
jgi:dimethylhistidine N-methyltransferase